MDTQQKILAAYQIEHREHLEKVRALLTDLFAGDKAAIDARLEEAFRRVHSLKGGARVCDLPEVEAIAHGLETHFSQLRAETLPLEPSTIQVVTEALDSIEDCMAALTDQESSADGASVGRKAAPPAQSKNPRPQTAQLSFDQQILVAFQAEQREYVAAIRAFLAQSNKSDDAGDELDEALRMAHNLRGAARVAGIDAVEHLGTAMESCLTRLQQGDLVLNEDLSKQISSMLTAIEHAMAGIEESQTAGEPAAPQRADPQTVATLAPDGVGQDQPESETAASAPSQKANPLPQETVRISAESLDQLLHSSGQLLTESARQDLIARELRNLNTQLDRLERQRLSLRKGNADGLHRPDAKSRSTRTDRYLESVERHLHALTVTARRIQRLQQRGAWLTKTRIQQIHDDVRRTRMAPAESVFQGFRKMVRDLAKEEGKQIDFRVSGFDVPADRMVLQSLKDPLMHMLCNAVTHGIECPDERRSHGKSEGGRIGLKIEGLGHRLCVTVEDDGRGIDLERVKQIAIERGLLSDAEARDSSPAEMAGLIFRPGFSTSATVSQLAGRGMGLSVVHEAVARLQGDVQVQIAPSGGVAFVISVPLSVSTHHLLLTTCRDQTFAIPVHGIERLLRVNVAEVETVEGRPIVNFQGRPIPLVGLVHLLGGDDGEFTVAGESLPVVIIRSGARRMAVAVDAFVAEGEFLIREFSGMAAKGGQFVGGAVLEDGNVALVIHPAELMKNLSPKQRVPTIQSLPAAAPEETPTILVVDDSFTTRTLEKSILETHGYHVLVAVDGMEALAQLSTGRIDLVISDIQMPRLDGFGLLEHIKKDPRLKHTPVVLVTSMDRREDQQRGLDLGAEAYIIKRKFDHQDLLKTIGQIL